MVHSLLSKDHSPMRLCCVRRCGPFFLVFLFVSDYKWI